MKKVYIVTSGCYSDYRIEGVFSTEEKAQEYIDGIANHIDKVTKEEDVGSCYQNLDFEIAPAELDLFETFRANSCRRYQVSINKNGDCRVSEDYDKSVMICTATHHRELNGLCIECWATDKQHAAKIANEIRTRLIANNEWSEK